MSNVAIPSLSFGPWTRWNDRHSIDGSDYPGVYVLRIGNSRFIGRKAKVADCHYIGMTNSRKGLKGRWGQFDRAIRGKRGHSGGNLIYSKLGHYDDWPKRLFVAAMPVICQTVDPTSRDYRLMGIVAYLEYEAFAVFRRSHPKIRKPRFNKK